MRARALLGSAVCILTLGCGGSRPQRPAPDAGTERPAASGGRTGTGGAPSPDAADAGSGGSSSGGSGPGGTGPGGTGAGGRGGGAPVSAALAPLFVTPARAACQFPAPIAVTSRGENQILIATADGVFTALDPATGAEIWRVSLTAPAGFAPHLASTPVVVESNRLVFAWQDVLPDWTRGYQRVGVIDLEARALDPQFPTVTVGASKPAPGGGTVNFVPAHTYARAALAHARVPGKQLGLVYVSYGNVRDLQPFHGWVIEIDLDEWKGGGATGAVTGSLVTTADVNCGPENGDGARQMMCGGGIWSHRGPQVIYDDRMPDGFQLLVPTGNGLLDPTRADFANSIMRVGRGLTFDPACDAMMCESFNPSAPSEACMTSCQNLFMPRLLPNQTVPEGPGRVCVGRTFLGCYAALDWDLGANSPAVVSLPGGPTVIVQPGKDGAVYLIDALHLGTLYDRAQIMAGCGEGGGNCSATWTGTIVTRPEIVTLDGAVLALVPTFVPDDVHPAGLQALEISMSTGAPRLVPRWQAPRFGDPESVRAFRHHAGGVAVLEVAGEPFAALVDSALPGQLGTLYLVRVRDGEIVQRVTLAGAGRRFAAPLVLGDKLYVPSCEHTGVPDFNEGPSHVLAYSIAPR